MLSLLTIVQENTNVVAGSSSARGRKAKLAIFGNRRVHLRAIISTKLCVSAARHPYLLSFIIIIISLSKSFATKRDIILPSWNSTDKETA